VGPHGCDSFCERLDSQPLKQYSQYGLETNDSATELLREIRQAGLGAEGTQRGFVVGQKEMVRFLQSQAEEQLFAVINASDA